MKSTPVTESYEDAISEENNVDAPSPAKAKRPAKPSKPQAPVVAPKAAGKSGNKTAVPTAPAKSKGKAPTPAPVAAKAPTKAKAAPTTAPAPKAKVARVASTDPLRDGEGKGMWAFLLTRLRAFLVETAKANGHDDLKAFRDTLFACDSYETLRDAFVEAGICKITVFHDSVLPAFFNVWITPGSGRNKGKTE